MTKIRNIDDVTPHLPDEISTARSCHDSLDSSTSRKPKQSAKHLVAQLFMRFGARYGNRWTSQIADDTAMAATIAEWRSELAGLTDIELSAGYQRLRNRRGGDLWPPTPPEYRQLCRPHREPYERPDFQAARLPAPRASAETARAHLAAIRAGKLSTDDSTQQRN